MAHGLLPTKAHSDDSSRTPIWLPSACFRSATPYRDAPCGRVTCTQQAKQAKHDLAGIAKQRKATQSNAKQRKATATRPPRAASTRSRKAASKRPVARLDQVDTPKFQTAGFPAAANATNAATRPASGSVAACCCFAKDEPRRSTCRITLAAVRVRRN
ncbi:hypothetical protein AOQ84DRAFT_221630 [Glonium stellatum]|uniref:Uncharacterized protein n=1 Tax=Glonium stellatum TaxID=574774 RepID=A0A8E2F1S1_9PEZI|nr:hypothetical protein AOQ84DRAFT_221630 [Glonium stellatum]